MPTLVLSDAGWSDQDGEITGLALPAGDTIALSYDAASRITGRTETGQPAQNFGYDALDRLAIYASGAATQTYAYDANGNRASYLDNATPPVSLSYNIDPASNRLIGIGGSWAGSFTYDASGNMLSYATPYSGYSFAYDARSRQTEAYVGAIGTGWLINGLGQRVAQMNGSVPEFFFVHDEAGHLTGKYDGGGNPLRKTAWLGDLPVAVLAPSGLFYIAPDHLGAPHQITDAGGAVVWQWNHDPFGNGDPVGGPYDLRFPGQYFDQATKLHYNYFRDYDPRLGRYIESDPIGLWGGISTYAYVGGNPVTRVDPQGLQISVPIPWDLPWYLPPGSTFDPFLPFPNTLESRGLPPGFWDAEAGAEEWGTRHGIDPNAARRRFHKIKQKCGGKPTDDFGVNPDTGDVVDSNGEDVGNLGQ